jgi:hypothetical protein
VGYYDNETLFKAAEGMGAANGLTADSDEDDILNAILDKVNKENGTNLTAADMYRYDANAQMTVVDTSKLSALLTDFDSSEYDDEIEKAKAAYNEAT